MLTELRIRNLAVVEDLEIAFEPGLNVITGDRGGPDLLRAGATDAEVEALFSGPAVANALAHDGSDGEESSEDAGDEATIRRVVTTTRQRAYVNDRLVTAARLGDIG